MTITNSYTSGDAGSGNNGPIHLRDARHAHQFFTNHNFTFAPKTKFLYHVWFEPRPEIDGNIRKFQKEMSVLVKSVDLPQFKISTETKQQYNRKKHIQTRIDYQEVNIRLHDDNLGAIRAILEEYYRHYYKDGSTSDPAYDPRDKYNEIVPKYGLDTGVKNAFFDYIKIYQLSRQEWFSYELVNPLITSWTHGDLAYEEGGGIVEHTITVAYEAVYYDSGSIGTTGEPKGFTSPETGYDLVKSPLTLSDPSIIESKSQPKLIESDTNTPSNLDPEKQFNDSFNYVPKSFLDQTAEFFNTKIPTVDTQNNPVVSKLDSAITTSEVNELTNRLNNDPEAKASFVAKALATGEGSVPLAEYNAASTDVKDIVAQDLVAKLPESTKLRQFASNVITASGKGASSLDDSSMFIKNVLNSNNDMMDGFVSGIIDNSQVQRNLI